MNPEQARELYSDYFDQSLSPALRQAMDQHFHANADAARDYAEFASVWSVMATEQTTVLDVPHGFRAAVLERLVTAQAAKPVSFGDRVRAFFSAGFGTVPQRVGGGAVALTLAGALVVSLLHGGGINRGVTGTATSFSTIADSGTSPTTALGVNMKAGDDGTLWYMFRIHLPQSVPSAVVNASVISRLDEVQDPQVRAQTATAALRDPKALANDEELQIPVALTGGAPTTGTLDLLVQWKPDDARLPEGAQVVFTPTRAAGTSAMAAPAAGTLFDALQYVSAATGATVVADASILGVASTTQWPQSMDANLNVSAVATAARLKYRLLANNTYQIFAQ